MAPEFLLFPLGCFFFFFAFRRLQKVEHWWFISTIETTLRVNFPKTTKDLRLLLERGLDVR